MTLGSHSCPPHTLEAEFERAWVCRQMMHWSRPPFHALLGSPRLLSLCLLVSGPSVLGKQALEMQSWPLRVMS